MITSLENIGYLMMGERTGFNSMEERKLRTREPFNG